MHSGGVELTAIYRTAEVEKMSVKVPASRTRVGKYELGRTLGEGSFAKVKFAKNVETGDFVAIKIVDRDQVLRHKMVEQVPCFSYMCINMHV